MADASTVWAIYYQPPSEDVAECIYVEVVNGPKRFARFWVKTRTLEWGWTLHPTAVKVYDVGEAP